MKSLRILSRLIDYPSIELWNEKVKMYECLQFCPELSGAQIRMLKEYLNRFYRNRKKILSEQAQFCDLFDRGQSLSLMLFEHVHGDSRERGQAMVDLLNEYHYSGLVLTQNETPDYLPVYLEYLSTLSFENAKIKLTDILPIIGVLAFRLKKLKSPRAKLFFLLIELSGNVYPKSNAVLQGEELTGHSLDEIDALWEESEILFSEKYFKSQQRK